MCKSMVIEMPFMYMQDCKFYWNKDGVTFDNQPVRPSRIKKLDCQYGPHYFKPKDRTTDRPVIQTTRKKDCPATITIREFEVFPDYGYSQDEAQKMSDYALRKFKLSKLESLRSALASQQPIKIVILYHVSLPSKAAHTKHNFEMKSHGTASSPNGCSENYTTCSRGCHECTRSEKGFKRIHKVRNEGELSRSVESFIFSNHR